MKKLIQHEKFLELYNNGLNDSKIAQYFNCTISCVTLYRKKLGLQLNENYSFDTQLYLQLYNEGHSDLEISKIMATDHRKFGDYRKKMNLSVYKKPSDPITDLQYSVIVGTVLGDGHIRRPLKTWNAVLNIGHGAKQKEYFLYKYELLRPLFSGYNEYPIFDKRKNHNNYVINATTRHNENLNTMHELFYVNGKKVINPKIFQYFTDLSLAIFFCDDGSRTLNGYNIAMNNFSDNDLDIFTNFMYEKYQIQCSVYKNHILYIPSKYKNKFTKIIEPYIIEPMQYKLHHVSSINSLNSVNTHSNMDNTEPSNILNEY